jgi:acyl-coenzyme A synthetase/AMP-(fatty) acid ligase
MSNLVLNLVATAGHRLQPQQNRMKLRQFARGRMAAYKYPRRIWFVDSLPTGPTGKLLRREVKPPPEEA